MVGEVNKTQNNSTVVYALESVPTFRRTVSIPDKIEKGQYTTAAGMAALALINLPEDCRDVIGAAKQVKSIFTGEEFKGAYDYKNYQHSFSFWKGTALEEWLHKNVDADKAWAKWLYSNDITLAQTNFGKKALSVIGAKEKDVIKTDIQNLKGVKAKAFSYEGNGFAKLTARAMRRTTKLGLIAMGLLELPKLANAFSEGDGIVGTTKSMVKQTVKSSVNVASITAGIAYCGAIGSKYGKGFGSLVGMGVGAILGSKLSDKIQQTI